MSWFADHGWLAWVGLALALGAIEAASVDFVFLMLAGGALAGALVSGLGASFPVQVVTAVAVAAVLLVAVRPLIRRHFMVPEGTAGIGTPAQIGRAALVIQTVTPLDGRIKLGGETWSARAAPGTADCLPGQEVRVVSIEGATAIVTSVAVGRKSESQ
jgi:membrane protein implicated in regulation of membrane protease activity